MLNLEDDNNHVESVEASKKSVNVLNDGTAVNNTGKRQKVEWNKAYSPNIRHKFDGPLPPKKIP